MEDEMVKFTYAYTVITVAGSPGEPQKSSTRLFLCCYWIFTLTVITFLVGNLMAMMTVTKLTLPVNTLQDLLEHPEYQIGAIKGSLYESMFTVPYMLFKKCKI